MITEQQKRDIDTHYSTLKVGGSSDGGANVEEQCSTLKKTISTINEFHEARDKALVKLPPVKNPAALIERWRKDAAQYSQQVAEARQRGTPHGQMLGWQQALQMCANDLAKALGLILLFVSSNCFAPIITIPFHAVWTNHQAWNVYFSPKGGCTQAIVAELAHAQNFILVQAYSFTSPQIANALVAANNRHVKVIVIADKGQKGANGSEIGLTLRSGIPTFIDSKHAIAHNKVIVIDGKEVLTGSFNFTTSAEEHNAENLLILRDTQLAFDYAVNWTNHLNHSDAFVLSKAAPASRGHL